MSDHEPSGPPSSPIPPRDAAPPPERSRTGSHPALSEGDAVHALRVVRDLRDGPAGVGKPPIAATGFEGSGLWKFTAQGFAGVDARLDAIEASLGKVLARLGTTDSLGAWLAKEGGKVLLTAAIVALLAYASGHWRW